MARVVNMRGQGVLRASAPRGPGRCSVRPADGLVMESSA